MKKLSTIDQAFIKGYEMACEDFAIQDEQYITAPSGREFIVNDVYTGEIRELDNYDEVDWDDEDEDYHPNSELQVAFNKGADLGFKDGLDRGYKEGFEAASELYDIDYPSLVELPSGKQEFLNNNPDRDDCEEDYDEDDYSCGNCELKGKLPPKEKCQNCVDKYSCHISPYYVGEYNTRGVLRVQGIIEQVEDLIDYIMGMSKVYKDKKDFDLVCDLDDMFDTTEEILSNLTCLQDEENRTAFEEYLNRIENERQRLNRG